MVSVLVNVEVKPERLDEVLEPHDVRAENHIRRRTSWTRLHCLAQCVNDELC